MLNSKIGPFSSIGDDVHIVDSQIEHSVIMQGSTIVSISHLEDSLIGKRVTVTPGFRTKGTISLMLGDDCIVEIKN